MDCFEGTTHVSYKLYYGLYVYMIVYAFQRRAGVLDVKRARGSAPSAVAFRQDEERSVIYAPSSDEPHAADRTERDVSHSAINAWHARLSTGPTHENSTHPPPSPALSLLHLRAGGTQGPRTSLHTRPPRGTKSAGLRPPMANPHGDLRTPKGRRSTKQIPPTQVDETRFGRAPQPRPHPGQRPGRDRSTSQEPFAQN